MNCFLKFLKESVVTTCEQSRIKFYRNHGKPRKTKGNSVAFTNLLLSYFILFLSSITQTYLIEDPGIQGSTLRLVKCMEGFAIILINLQPSCDISEKHYIF